VLKRYTVTGTRPQFGHQPGTEFEADIPEAQERRLLAKGAIKECASKQEDDGLFGLSRIELNRLATEAGVENPYGLPNKGEVIRAIEVATEPAIEPDTEPDAFGNDNEEE
jgi:hypothetical protein